MGLALFMSDENFTLEHQYFDKVIYINLKSRNARNEHIISILKKMEIPDDKIIRFEAIEDNPGFIGCARSHAAVMDMVIKQNLGTVLVLEDDADFYTDLTHIRQANKFLACLNKRPWDVALLGGNYYLAYTQEPDNYLLKLMLSFCAHAYIVNQNYSKTVLKIFNESIELMNETIIPNESKGIDVHWCSYMEKDNWYGLYPCIARQRDDYSNIRGGYIHYGDLFNKSLDDMCIETILLPEDNKMNIFDVQVQII